MKSFCYVLWILDEICSNTLKSVLFVLFSDTCCFSSMQT